MFEGGTRVSGLAARWHIGSECMTQPWAVFQQSHGSERTGDQHSKHFLDYQAMMTKGRGQTSLNDPVVQVSGSCMLASDWYGQGLCLLRMAAKLYTEPTSLVCKDRRRIAGVRYEMFKLAAWLVNSSVIVYYLDVVK